MIEVVSPTALATVQDLGRNGALRWGVGNAGAMDPLALAAGNILVGNEPGAAGIEVQVFPFEIRSTVDCTVAVTGADCAAALDGRPLLPWCRYPVGAGRILRLGPPRCGPWTGARAYVCVSGGIDVPLVLNSRSTQLRGAIGGLGGRTLRQGDRLPVGSADGRPVEPLGLTPPARAMPLESDGYVAVRVLPAAEYEAFTEASVAAFWTSPWRITTQSDRYGFRLSGPTIEPKAPLELRSHGIVPGVIQVPHGGQPIVQMRDAQPSGGYPKIGTVVEADLWRLGQAPIGSLVRFLHTDWDGAVAALAETERWLDGVRRFIGLYDSRSRAR